tara:strand:+ start:1925 stop:3046 length:1122 start_codon:yes stop_codon:yes gene_type:complete
MSISVPSPSQTSSDDGVISVMLVDDSSVVRGMVARLIETDKAIQIVSSVSNGQQAIDAANRRKPDVVILDVEMPVMDGLTALPQILKASPKSKVIMFSSLTEKGASVSLRAFSAGAVECLVKPNSSQDVGEGSEFQRYLLNLIKGFYPDKQGSKSHSSASPAPSTFLKPAKTISLHQDPMAYRGPPSLIAIGSSTGGPQALFEVLKNCHNLNAPIVITQHMPATFTKILAEHITQKAGLPAAEGENGMILENGKAYVAPGGLHMIFEKDGTNVKIVLDDGPQENFCKPAVDPMFRSAIDIFGNRVLGVILTGMGQDGLNGGQALVNAGGRLIAQDEESSVVWGMPGAVANAGICSEILPLRDVGPWIKKAALG